MCDFIYTIVATLVGVIIGGIITWYVSKKYYKRASQEMKEESDKLIKKINLILRSMEEAGLIEYTRDEQGNIKGLVIKLSGSIKGKSNMHGTIEQ